MKREIYIFKCRTNEKECCGIIFSHFKLIDHSWVVFAKDDCRSLTYFTSFMEDAEQQTGRTTFFSNALSLDDGRGPKQKRCHLKSRKENYPDVIILIKTLVDCRYDFGQLWLFTFVGILGCFLGSDAKRSCIKTAYPIS